MKLTTIFSTALFLGVTQLVGAEALTSTLTTTITRTLVRVNAVTSTPTPTHSTPLIPTTTPGSSSTLIPSASTEYATVTTTTTPDSPEDPEHTNAAAGFEGNMRIAVAGGAVALLLGAL
ncbi:hypothetical protein BJY04DRAFT_218531 [Aspergillus karnatakaensis]|uniref:uncharacterized protein n=1 Tax=Aspergillus karnatakaensis TaxID=1810916 RepID=UPI003CCDBB4D